MKENKKIVNENINEYLSYIKLERNLSKETYNSYKYGLSLFEEYFNYKIDNLKKDDIKKYILHLNNTVKPISVNNYISILRGYYNYISDNSTISNLMIGIDHEKTPKRLPNYLSIEEVDKLLDIKLDTKFDYRNKAMLELMYATGVRVSELTTLKLNNYDSTACILRLIGKGNKERIVPIGDMAIKYLNLYINEYRNLFFNKKNQSNEYIFLNNHGNSMSRSGFNRILQGIKTEQEIDKYLSPHIIRHSFATHLIEGGADLRSVQILLGHEHITTTEIYTHLSNKYLRDSYEKYHPRSKKEE